MSEQSTMILLVEDEYMIQAVVEAALTDAGYAVTALDDASKALEVIERDGSTLCGLVTDVDLGDSPNGWELATRARELNPAIPVVYITGGSGHEWPAHGVPQSIIISKPFPPLEVVIALANLRNSSPA